MKTSESVQTLTICEQIEKLNLKNTYASQITDHRYIIFTDLDGTMIGHDDYQFGSVPAILHKLQQQCVSVIFNTSKTWAEVQEIQKQLNYFAPCVVENGGGIHVPALGPWQPLTALKLEGSVSREDINKVLDQVGQEFNFERFRDWNINKLIQHTGLQAKQAEQANQRLYSEPLLWCDTSTALVRFKAKLQDFGLRLVQGGRFCHVMGQQDKSIAMAVLIAAYESEFNSRPLTIALGDNQNDHLMLLNADIACVMPLPDRPVMQLQRKSATLYSNVQAPQGWTDFITQLLFES